MKPSVLFIVTGDPRISPRPAEAVRIAAGISAWKRAEIGVYLRGEAVLALGESAEGLVDEDGYAQYWPMLVESNQPIYVQKNAPALRKLGPATVRFAEISDGQLAELAADQTCVIRF